VCDFSRINFYKRPDDGSQLQPKHVAVNKLKKFDDVRDRFNACTWDRQLAEIRIGYIASG
jgi:hypothetical protein